MGSDQIKLLNQEYMDEFWEGLEGTEKVNWEKHRRGRAKKERERYRKMAIKGYMKPTKDMQDVYQNVEYKYDNLINLAV